MRVPVAAVVLCVAALAGCADALVAPALTVFDRWYGTTPIPDRNLAHTPSAWKVPVNEATLPWLSLLPTWDALNATAVDGSVVPFVDEIATVRCLGGWDARYGRGNASDDIIDADWNFRWNLLDERIDQWVFANMSILFVLDNVPYVFTDGHPVLGPFGQDAPPVNKGKFEWFVGEVVQHLQQRYGVDYVSSRFRFRVGTEPDGPRYGNISEYVGSYIAAAKGVKKHSPASAIGAGNWLHQGKDYATDQQFEDIFYETMKNHDVPVDFVAQSDYVQGWKSPGGRRYPCFLANGSDAMLHYATRYGVSTLPREVHEFAPLYNRAHRTSVEPGSFGVSFYVACWAAGLQSGLRRIFHWGTAREAGVGGELWTGYGWAMAMAELLVGADVSAIHVPNGCEQGAFALSSPRATLVTAFDPYRDEPAFNVTFRVPHAVSRVYSIDAATSPFDVMLRDAAALNYTQYKDGLPYGMRDLLNPAGQQWIRRPDVFAKFVELQRQTFTSQPMNVSAGSDIVIPSFTTLMLVA